MELSSPERLPDLVCHAVVCACVGRVVVVGREGVGSGCASIVTVDAPGITGEGVSMVLDQDDFPVMAYQTRPVSPGLTFLQLARCSDPVCAGPITIERIDEVTRSQFGPSLALDAAGRPVIAYNNNDRDLVVVHCTDQSCAAAPSTATIASGDDFPVRPSLVLDASGNPVVAHQVSNAGGEQGVRVQRCADPDCSAPPSVATIDTTASFQLSLAMTDDDRPVVALKTPSNIDEGNLRIATCADPGCSSVTLADIADNCPNAPNADQLDTDADDVGDVCDLDDDGDGQADDDEVACSSDPLDSDSRSPDGDGDGVPDCVDSDTSTTVPATASPATGPPAGELPATGASTGATALLAGVVLTFGLFASRLARR